MANSSIWLINYWPHVNVDGESAKRLIVPKINEASLDHHYHSLVHRSLLLSLSCAQFHSILNCITSMIWFDIRTEMFRFYLLCTMFMWHANAYAITENIEILGKEPINENKGTKEKYETNSGLRHKRDRKTHQKMEFGKGAMCVVNDRKTVTCIGWAQNSCSVHSKCLCIEKERAHIFFNVFMCVCVCLWNFSWCVFIFKKYGTNNNNPRHKPPRPLSKS